MIHVLLWAGGVVGGLIVLYIVFMVLGTLQGVVFGHEPKGVTVTAVAPPSARVGEDVVVTVTVRDTLGRARVLRSVDLDRSYLAGLVVQSVTPRPVEMPSAALLGTYVFKMKETIGPGSAIDAQFVCRAVKAGDFEGEVTVYVDSGAFRYVRRAVRTVVT